MKVVDKLHLKDELESARWVVRKEREVGEGCKGRVETQGRSFSAQGTTPGEGGQIRKLQVNHNISSRG